MGKIKIRLVDYHFMTEEERLEYLVSELEKETGFSLRQGVDRFEGLLQMIGFSGRVSKKVQRDIYEMYSIRNVLVHRRGVADRKLVQACPWLELRVGSSVRINHKIYQRYSSSVSKYVLELIQRARVHFGLTRYRAKITREFRGQGKTGAGLNRNA